ncbi:MAG: hypothetical protein BWX92_03353 [Deltaproteobacteria bacterium ADurb.Bin135]|nr:MAG: hypothetical protein BWX92_03353 [Deltaproteobacteria bacterium ADurb.Bin135]
MFDQVNDGYCPQCLLDSRRVALMINADDIWECPDCNLQLHNCNFFFMAVMRRRGHGDLKNISAVGRVRGKILTKAAVEDEFNADTSGFRSEDDFKSFLKILDRQDLNTWPLTENTIKIDWSLQKLRDYLNKTNSDQLYYYVVDTVKYSERPNRQIYNTGSAPNFQGGVITLCTCKHSMRAKGDFSKDVWVAGISSLEVGRKWGIADNILFYLGKVKHSFQSYRELIDYFNVFNPQILHFKNACLNKRGDVYIPRKDATDYFDPNQYENPCLDHVHNKQNTWYYDVKKYISANGHLTYQKYLLFDENFSFAWNKKAIRLDRGCNFSGNKKAAITSGCKHVILQEFIGALKEV